MNLLKISSLQISYLLGVILIISCTKEIEVKIPKEEHKLVVNSFFTPDKNIEVYVSQSAYIYDSVTVPVNNAIVILYANNNFIDTLTFQDKGIYLSNIKPVVGKEYRLNVTADGYTGVTTFDRIPEKASIISSSRIDNFGVTEYETAYSQLKVTFRDNQYEQNFYEIILIYYYDHDVIYPYDDDSTTSSFARLNSNDPVIASEVEIDNGWWHQSLFFSDELFNGQEYTLSAIYRIILSPIIYEDYTLYVHLNSISENYYNYKRKLYQYNQSTQDLWNNTGEAVQIFSNVDNGYGIFAGYSSDIDTIFQN